MSIHIDSMRIGFIAAYSDAGGEEVATVGVGLFNKVLLNYKKGVEMMDKSYLETDKVRTKHAV